MLGMPLTVSNLLQDGIVAPSGVVKCAVLGFSGHSKYHLDQRKYTKFDKMICHAV